MRKTLKKKEKKKELLNKRKEGEDLRRKRCRERNCHRFGESFWPIFRVESNRSISRSCNYVSSMPPSKVASCATVRRKRPRGPVYRQMDAGFPVKSVFSFSLKSMFPAGEKNWLPKIDSNWIIVGRSMWLLIYVFYIILT